MRLALAVLILLTCTGCSTGAGSTLSCPGPGATGCASLDTVYQDTAGKNTDATQVNSARLRQLRTVQGAQTPSLHPARVQRVWLAPWEDDEGDLHDFQYLYLVVEPARWNVDYLRIAKTDE